MEDMKTGLLFESDPRDYRLSDVVGLTAEKNYPKEFDIKYKFKNNIYQYNIGACCACACTACEMIQFMTDEQLSQWFLYANRNNSDWQGTGMYVREALSNMIKFGIPNIDMFDVRNKEYPQIKEYLNSLSQKESIFSDASKHKIEGYIRIEKDEVKSIISQGYPVLIGVRIYSNFYKCQSNGGEIPSTPEGTYKGGHQLLVTGYTQDKYNILNWWPGSEKLTLSIDSSIIKDYYIITDKPIKKPIDFSRWEKINPKTPGESVKWKYVKSDGSYSKSEWIQIKNDWFYIGNDEIAYSNRWILWNGKWYYFDIDCYMRTNYWCLWKGKWYYLDSDGAMAINIIIDGKYYVDQNGVWDGITSQEV